MRLAEMHLIIDKEFASYYEEQDHAGKDVSKGLVESERSGDLTAAAAHEYHQKS